MAKKTQIICSNVFKSKNTETLKEEFNKKFVQVIKQIENNKNSIVDKEQ